ncbi:MAG: argininosuccinate synthase [Vicinamibacterales bacterium]
MRVVLAYSGGLKASVAIPWLIETFDAQVVAVALDLGQGDDLVDVRQRALAAGAVRCHVIDAREEFARDFVLPSVKAGALFEGRYPIPTALGRPLIAKTLVAIARVEEAAAVAHAGSGRDHLRLTAAMQDLDPALRVIACAEAWSFTTTELEDFAERHNIAAAGPTRTDQNLWGRTVGRWADAASSALADGVVSLTRPPEGSPEDAAVLEIEFSYGVPKALNGVPMAPVELIDSLTTIGAEHGIGRLTRVKARAVDRVSYAIYEAPAAVLLHAAHAELQRQAAPGPVQRIVPAIASSYSDVIDRGEWFSNLRPALDAVVNHVQEHVTGVVQLKLHNGSVTTATSIPSASLTAGRQTADV